MIEAERSGEGTHVQAGERAYRRGIGGRGGGRTDRVIGNTPHARRKGPGRGGGRRGAGDDCSRRARRRRVRLSERSDLDRAADDVDDGPTGRSDDILDYLEHRSARPGGALRAGSAGQPADDRDSEHQPDAPGVGEKVTFTIHGHDPDAANGGIREWYYGDGPHVIADPFFPACDHDSSWTPEPAGPHDWDITMSWTYSKPGTFHPSFEAWSATPNIGGCPDPYASSAVAEGDVTVTADRTQDSVNAAAFSCNPPTAISAVHYDAGEELPPLDFHAYGACDNASTGQGDVRADLTNRTDQPVYFPKGIDVVVHLRHDGGIQDVHVTDPNTTSLAPGQHVEVKKGITVDQTGGYDVSATVTYGFVPPAAS
ncbi:MAG: hypothetical protein JO176_03520 [Acidimicrobiia bacterium]|nr:hypothetical protein [Acidimicrobiia bacterium]